MLWHEKYGPWALVTGASSGLGAEFARQLAARGLNTILVARRQDRMEALAAEIQQTWRVHTRIISVDLTADGACKRVAEQTEDLEIGLLINNAGYGLYGAYQDQDPDRLVNMTVLNCVVPVLLTNIYLPRMLERGRGGLIFLASTSAYQATPYLGAYGATKAFNLMLGESIWQECKKTGVDSFALSPGFTNTEFTDVAKIQGTGPFLAATPSGVVSFALKNLGKKPSGVHGLINKFLSFSGRFMPRRVVIAITSLLLKNRAQTP